MSELDQRIAALPLEKRALLEQKLRALQAARTPTTIPHLPDANPTRLSFAQERIWFLGRLEPDDTSFNEPTAYRLNGPLDADALERALRTVVARHEILRSVVRLQDGVPMQQVDPDGALALERHDLTSLPADERPAAVEALIQTALARPFQLERDLLLRATLYRLGPAEHVLLLVKHHIACDGWSARLIVREMIEGYAAAVEGRPPRLPELPVQYRDYAAWQRHEYAARPADADVAYWRAQLDGLTPVEIPADRPMGASLSARGGSVFFTLDAAATEQLRALTTGEGATPFMGLLSGLLILLHRYTGHDDLAVGTIVAHRKEPQVEHLVGPLINTLVLRVDFSGAPTVREALARVRAVTLATYDHQDLPFERLLEELQPGRDVGRSPLFRALLVYQGAAALPEMPGLSLHKLPAPVHTAKLPLSLYVTETADGLQARLEYSADLFDAATIRRMAGHLETLLHAMAADPDQPIGTLALLPAAERSLVLEQWNDTAVDYGEQPDIVRQFTARVARDPDATAFVTADARLTFAELNARANRLARLLIGRGVQAGDRIGVAIEKSLEAPIALLAVFKAGGVYVPLDPEYPAQRLRFMIEDSAARCVITRTRWLAALTSAEGDLPTPVDFVILDAMDDALAALPGEDVPVVLDPDAPAYIVYTSGSTGAPKGALVPHRQILNRLRWMWDAYPQGPDDVGSVKSALSFVDSLWELLGYLLQGTPAAIIPDAVMRDPHLLVDTLAQHRVTQAWLVPSLLRAILNTVPDLAARLPRLRFWVSTGEVLPRDLFEQFGAAMPHAVLGNIYGTSEVWDATWYDPRRSATTGCASDRVPIGRPIANVRVYVLDAQRQPVPIGVPGELYVGGLGLAFGYVNRPALTAERFVPDPFAGEPGAQMYRTGDLAKWLPGGEIELLGRADFQLKVRGWRVEPGEIESLLRRQEAIKDAVVLADGAGDAVRLVAYVAPEEGRRVDQVATRGELARHLPAALIPARVIVLDAFPTTPSGKVNRKVLAAMTIAGDGPAPADAAPAGRTEQRLARLWMEELRLSAVGVHDDFFALGGHSLLGVRLFARIEEEFGVRLPLSLLFSAPTIAQLAQQMDAGAMATHSPIITPIQTEGTRPPFFCVHGFGGGVLGYAELARLLGPDQPFYGLQALGYDGAVEPDTDIETMAAHYVEAMRTVQPKGPYRIGGYCYGGVVAYEMARQLEAIGETTALVAVFEGFAPSRFHTRTPAMHPRRLLTIWRSLPYWARDYVSMDKGWLLEATRARLERRSRRAAPTSGDAARREIVAAAGSDLTGVPAYQQQLMRIHLQALRNYSPEPYHGRVTLFRSDWQSVSRALFGALDPEYGWGALAEGGVEVRMIAGAHRNIHMAPHVASLAAQLRQALDAALDQ